MDDPAKTAAAAESAVVKGELDELAAVFGVPTVDRWRPWWACTEPVDSRQFSAYVGLDPQGTAAVDVDIMAAPLGGDGPHGVVLGGPQTGKTEALTTLILSLCATYTPDHIRIWALTGDPNTGSDNGLHALGALPHVDIVNTDAAPAARSAALLAALSARVEPEVRTRRQALRQLHPAHRPDHGPHLLIVVDDYHLLETEQDAEPWRELLWRTISRGTMQNIHVVLASRVLSPAVRVLLPHCGYRIIMGTHDIDAPADLSSTPPKPGRGLVATAQDEVWPCVFFNPSGDGGRIRDALIERILAHSAH